MVKKFLAIFFISIFALFSLSSPAFALTGSVGTTCNTANDGQSCQFYNGTQLSAGVICKGTCMQAGTNCASISCTAAKNVYIPQVQKTADGAAQQEQTPNARGLFFTGSESVLSSLAILTLQGDPTTTVTDAGGQRTLGGVQSVGNLIGQLYNPPATANEYVADVMHDAGIATPAYAQGLGFSSLAPVLETWKVFRTIAYFFYVVIFLIIGFMIMFRQKIGSQTVVTVQQALPKLLVSLIAVTFSYAIAGLMIEIMYLAMFLILNVFVAGALGKVQIAGGENLQSFGSNSNIFAIAGIIINGGTLDNVSKSVGTMVQGALGISSTTPGASFLGSVTGLAAVVVFAIALLFSIFRLFFDLLKIYITIIIMIVTAPLALMLGALPGNNAFANWLKGLFFHLAAFPVVLVTIVMAFLLQTSISANGGFLPPYIGGDGTAGAVAPLLGLGVLLVIPDIVEKVRKMAPAGPFDDLANKAGAALKKGYSGGELIPGLGFTNTAKLPGGGLTGENVLRKGAIGAAAVAGTYYGALRTPAGSKAVGAKVNAGNFANFVGGKLGDKQFKPDEKKAHS